MPIPLDPLVVGLFGLAGSAVSSFTNYYAQKRTNEMAIEQANLQYARQKADIRAMNNYNSPASQVIRLRSAGISPALYYGGAGAAVAGEQSSVPTYNTPNLKAPSFDFGGIVSSLADMSTLPLELQEKQNNIKKLGVEIDFALKNNPYLLEKARLDIETAKQNLTNLRNTAENILADTRYKNMSIDKIAQELQMNVVNTMILITKLPYELLNMDADTALKWAQKNKNDADVLQGWATLAELTRHNKETERITERGISLQDVQFWDQFNEAKRHNKVMEGVEVGKAIASIESSKNSVFWAVRQIADYIYNPY